MNDGGLGIAHLAGIHPIGGSSNLFAATDLKLGRQVAVRVFDAIESGANRSRFNHESQVLASLSSHPNIVTVYDAGFTETDRPYLVMERVDGQSLSQQLSSSGPMAWNEAAELALQVCAGLEQGHRAGALHRDLRPNNILMAGSLAKLTDFGITRINEPDEQQDPGRLQHRAPEALSYIWDERTDLYSLASVLYQMIDGAAPFWRPNEQTSESLRHRLANEQAPGLDPDLAPAALSEFLLAGLAKESLDRPQNASEFAHELRLITEGHAAGPAQSVLHNTSAVPQIPEVQSATVVPSQLTKSTTVSEGAPAEPIPAASPNWAPPDQSQWQPETPNDGTAIYSDFASPNQGYAAPADPYGNDYSPPATSYQAPPIAADADPPAHQVQRKSSPAFAAALAMVAIGVVGLAAVFAINSFGSNEATESAPALPDPTETVTIDDETGQPVDNGAVDDSTDGAAMAGDDTTSTTEPTDDPNTTETTVQLAEVPNLVGMKVEEATRLLNEAGFEVLVVGRQAVSVEPGTVFQQTPVAGQQVTQPLSVTLFIPNASNLPEMVGRPADTVCLELQALGVTCERELMYNDQVPAGSVIATDPTGGSLFSAGTAVRVIVSQGPVVSIAIPDVAGLTEAEADPILTDAGFAVLVKLLQASDEVEQGRVIGTDPAIGASLAVDRPLTVRISSGPSSQPATVPNLVGMSAADAEAALDGLGLETATLATDLPEGDPGIGTVTATDPEAGSEVSPGSTVTITVGQLQDPSPEENPENPEEENSDPNAGDAEENPDETPEENSENPDNPENP